MTTQKKVALKLLRRFYAATEQSLNQNLSPSEVQNWANKARGLAGALTRILPGVNWLQASLDTIAKEQVILILE